MVIVIVEAVLVISRHSRTWNLEPGNLPACLAKIAHAPLDLHGTVRTYFRDRGVTEFEA
jgi:hypothetical protein